MIDHCDHIVTDSKQMVFESQKLSKQIINSNRVKVARQNGFFQETHGISMVFGGTFQVLAPKRESL